MDQLTKSVWFESPFLQQQLEPDPCIPDLWADPLAKVFGSPFILFRIRDELVRVLKKRAAFYASPLVTIFVIINPEIFDTLVMQTQVPSSFNPEGYLSQWLNEQISILNNLEKSGWPNINCIVQKAGDPYTAKIHIAPNMLGELVVGKLSRILSGLNKSQQDVISLAGADAIEKPAADGNCPPFWFQMPPQRLHGKSILNFKVRLPGMLYGTSITVSYDLSQSFGLKDILRINPGSGDVLPFVAEDHIEITASKNGSYEQIWVRPYGEQETWVIGNQYHQLPVTAWTPVSDGNAIVLGRVFRTEDNQFKILNGSAILEVCREDEGV